MAEISFQPLRAKTGAHIATAGLTGSDLPAAGEAGSRRARHEGAGGGLPESARPESAMPESGRAASEGADGPPADLAERWRALEAGSAGGFFRSWTYVGTLLRHMAAPWLLSVTQEGRDVALGVFNRSPGRAGPRFSLHETGDPDWDRLYVEHNGLLLRTGGAAVLQGAFEAALRRGSLVLSGIDEAHRSAASQAGMATTRSSQFAPALDLRALPDERPFLESVSANARAQIRRAMRLYGAGLTLQRAADADEGLHFFGRLVALHQAAWTARGRAGAFAGRAILDFHSALIRTGVPRGEVNLLRVSAGDRDVGYLYNFQHSGRVLSYQSGLATDADARLKPGLVCHALAIEQAKAEGFATYDLLAGAQRYKLTLAPQGGETMHWVIVHRKGSVAARIEQVRQFLQGATGFRPAYPAPVPPSVAPSVPSPGPPSRTAPGR